MNGIALLLLRALHILQSLLILISSCWLRVRRKQPKSLQASRRRTPQHLAVLFTADDLEASVYVEQHLLDNVENLVNWCSIVGTSTLSVYDRYGILVSISDKIQERIANRWATIAEDACDGAEYLLTPPPSEYSDSRPLSPVDDYQKPDLYVTIKNDIPIQASAHYMKQRKPSFNARCSKSLTLYLLSETSSKHAIANAASFLARDYKESNSGVFRLDQRTLAAHIEDGPYGIPSPDFMIVHPLSLSMYSRAPLEFRGFPPWQIRLTEVHLNRYRRRHRTWLTRLLPGGRFSLPLTEVEFREALDEFAAAEMRFGK